MHFEYGAAFIAYNDSGICRLDQQTKKTKIF